MPRQSVWDEGGEGDVICEKTLADAIRPKLNKDARARVAELIEAEDGFGDTQLASDIQFLLDYHDKVHAAWEDAE